MSELHRVKSQIIEFEMSPDQIGETNQRAMARAIAEVFEEVLDEATLDLGTDDWVVLDKVAL
ncbi:MAG: hypothetical protein AAFO69_21830, partial [Bacteroidota bacterium]